MHTRRLIPALLAVLLSACGGDSEPQATAPAASEAVRTLAVAGPAEQITHADTVAQLYLAYFMRPADPGGQENFSRQLEALGLPDDIHEVNATYSSSLDLKALIDSFSASTESRALYGWSDNIVDEAFIGRVYENLLGREPDFDGLQFWAKAMRDGQLTRSRIALMIASAAQKNQSAQGLRDGALIRNRVQFSTLATSELRRHGLSVYYVGLSQAALGRSYMLMVTADDTPATIATKVTNFVKQVKGEPIFCDPGPCIKLD